ncbi:hypothetical protein NP233_g5280 [Leucocoprinus birnbaumii]|uniref:Integral membrane protein n=1 Tax=Leucocoprinus birnbaumii TaxID=56174 RepID=A0AAD5VVH8_9AGAR|nr:hypothetical protein NP233_g5280 [Leucocoprinus birnbaumii]
MTMHLHNFVAVSFTGALAFGLYFATLLTCLRWLLFTHEGPWVFKKDIRWVIVTITFLIFASNVVYLSMSLYGTMLSARHAVEDPPGVSFKGPSWTSIVACTAANCNVLLADIVLIYRCWIIYEKRFYIVIFPSFLWLGALVCTVLQIYLQVMHTIDAKIGPYTWASNAPIIGIAFNWFLIRLERNKARIAAGLDDSTMGPAMQFGRNQLSNESHNVMGPQEIVAIKNRTVEQSAAAAAASACQHLAHDTYSEICGSLKVLAGPISSPSGASSLYYSKLPNMVADLDQRVSVVFVGALAFGLYAVTLLICLRWLLFVDEGWRLRKGRSINWPIIIVALLILACNLAYLIETFEWTKVAVWHAIHFPFVDYGKPEWTSIVSCTVANANVLLADIVLITRCWIVYDRRRVAVILFPSFLWVGALVCTVLQIYLQVAHTHDPSIGPYSWASVNMTMGPGIVLVPFWISTVLLNAYIAVALIWRIYSTTEHCRSSTSTDYFHFIIHAVAESGILHFSITIAHFLSWFGKSEFATDIISVLNAPIIGIAFHWFLIRVARRKAEEQARGMSSSKQISTLKFTPGTNRRETGSIDDEAVSDRSSAGEPVILSSPKSNSQTLADHCHYDHLKADQGAGEP